MSKHEKDEPAFFRWIRAARAEIARDTEGMTAEEHVAYIHAQADESRRERACQNAKKSRTKPKTGIKAEIVGKS